MWVLGASAFLILAGLEAPGAAASGDGRRERAEATLNQLSRRLDVLWKQVSASGGSRLPKEQLEEELQHLRGALRAAIEEAYGLHYNDLKDFINLSHSVEKKLFALKELLLAQEVDLGAVRATGLMVLPTTSVGVGSISGRVTDGISGQPLGGVIVHVRSSAYPYVSVVAVTTDSDGQYLAENLPAGSDNLYTDNGLGYINGVYQDIWCEYSCYWHFYSAQPVFVSSGEITSGVDVALEQYGSLSGTVLENGSELPLSAFIRLYDGNGYYVAPTQTSADGSYQMSVLPGTY